MVWERKTTMYQNLLEVVYECLLIDISGWYCIIEGLKIQRWLWTVHKVQDRMDGCKPALWTAHEVFASSWISGSERLTVAISITRKWNQEMERCGGWAGWRPRNHVLHGSGVIRLAEGIGTSAKELVQSHANTHSRNFYDSRKKWIQTNKNHPLI